MELQTDLNVRLYTMERRHFFGVIVSFFVLFALAVFVGVLGPKVITKYQLSASQEGLSMTDNSTFHWQIDHVDKLNQQIWFTMTVKNKYWKEEGISTELSIHTALDGSKDEIEWNALTPDAAFEFRELTCEQGKEFCKNITLLHVPFLHYNYYRVAVQLLNSRGDDFIEDVTFTWNTFNHSFTLYELWFRFFFLCASFIAVFAFSYQLRGIPFRSWNLTQKWLAGLLFSLLLYNNPFFPLVILLDSWLPNFLDVIFLASYTAVLLLFLLCVFDGIRKTKAERKYAQFYLPKLLLIGVLWLAAVITWTWEDLHALDNPNYSTPDEIDGFVFFRVAVIVLLITYVFWVLYAVLRSASDTEVVPYLRVQLKFLGAMTFFVIALTVVGVVLGIVGTVRNNAAQFLSYIALNNLYVFVLAFVYLPASGSAGGIENAHMIRQVDEDEEGYEQSVNVEGMEMDDQI